MDLEQHAFVRGHWASCCWSRACTWALVIFLVRLIVFAADKPINIILLGEKILYRASNVQKGDTAAGMPDGTAFFDVCLFVRQ
jgi:hypothetical protein